MTEATTIAAPESPTAPQMPASFSDPYDAFQFLSERREKQAAAEANPEPPNSPAGADPGDADTELPEPGNAAPAEPQATGETQEQDPASEPPLPLPRSWTKEQTEHWNALPRATQEFLTEQASQASAEVRRVQNEAAEKLKGLTAREQAAEQAKAQYEQKAREALDVLAREQQRDFGDIKSVEDVIKLSQTDPLRYLQWDAHQKQIAAVKETVDAAEARAKTELQTKRQSYQLEQLSRLREMVPELTDDSKYQAVWDKAMPVLNDLGLSKENLARWIDNPTGYEILLSAGFQKLVSDSLRLAEMQAATKAAVTKPVPPVQRPGVRQPGNTNSERLQALTNRFNSSGDLDDAVALLGARRSAQRRG